MRQAGKQRSFGSKAPTRAQRMARAINYVMFCTPERQAALTAEEVVSFAGIMLPEAQRLLARVQERGE